MERALSLADLLAPGTNATHVVFPSEGVTTTIGDLWRRGASVGRWNRTTGRQPVAMALTNTSSCVACILGAISCGVTLVSIPPPPRAADLEWYARFVAGICRQAGARHLAVDHALLRILPPVDGIEFIAFERILDGSDDSPEDGNSFELIQFTSGSTSDPKGVVLPQAKIATNVKAIVSWLEPAPGDGAAFWLPLSHDMGLIGMLFSSIAGAGDNFANGGHIVVMTPENFLHRPLSWLRLCEEYGTTITCSPSFGLQMTSRRYVGQEVDLSRLRSVIVGGESINADSLVKFADLFRTSGFSSLSFCPAYGLAECTLAVTGVAPTDHWTAESVDPVNLSLSSASEDEPRFEIVSSGQVLRDVEVTIDPLAESQGGQAAIGEIFVRGEAVSDRYLDGTDLKDPEGWFHTGDIGFMDRRGLHIVGREDDIFQIAGRKVFGVDIESHVGELEGIRSGRVVAVYDTYCGLVILAERDDQGRAATTLPILESQIRGRVRGRMGISPRHVSIVERGSLPMTSSGKMRREIVRKAIVDGTIDLRAKLE